MSLKNMLINHFLTSLKNSSINESITVLALIGIEQVMQDQSISNQKESFLNEIQMIKNQIKVLNESINFDQTPAVSQNKIKINQDLFDRFPQKQAKSNEQTRLAQQSFDRPTRNKKQRKLTPKITEISAAVYEVQTIKPRVSRHHLDDQAMKEALTQQFQDWDESIIQEKPKTPQVQAKQVIPVKKQKSNSPKARNSVKAIVKPLKKIPMPQPQKAKPPQDIGQSLNYFIPIHEDQQQQYHFREQVQQINPCQAYEDNRYENKLSSKGSSGGQQQSRRSEEQQQQYYQSQAQQRSSRGTISQRSRTDYAEVQNDQYSYDQMTSELLQKYQQQLQLPTGESLQEDQIRQYIKKQDHLQASDTFSFQPQHRVTGGTSNFSLQNDWNEDQTRHHKRPIQTVTSPNFESKNSQQPQSQQNKHSLLELATDLLNSPIIRQISMKNSSSEEKVAVVQKLKSNDSIQVSGFEVNQRMQASRIIDYF